MASFTVKALDQSTWPDFARLVEKHNGVWGGCWCIGFHEEGCRRNAALHRADKERRVSEGTTHAALVYDGPDAIGWCQFGPTEELPRIKHKKVYQAGLTKLPDWRITCFFVDKEYRGKGVTSVALAGALNVIAQLGGGVVESYPEDTQGRKTSGAFLYNASLSIFENQGFERTRQLGKHHWVVTKLVKGKT
jgi:GNAT superfamily N-acetyltransferase